MSKDIISKYTPEVTYQLGSKTVKLHPFLIDGDMSIIEDLNRSNGKFISVTRVPVPVSGSDIVKQDAR